MPRMPLSRRLAAPDAAECTICCLGAGRVPLWRCPDAPDAAECTIRRPRAADRRGVSRQTPGCAGAEATLLKRRSYIRRDVGQREAVFPSRRIRIVQSAQSGAPAAYARSRAACPCEKREALRPHEQRVRARSAAGTRGAAAAPTPVQKSAPWPTHRPRGAAHSGGGGEIRTLETDEPPNGFQDRRIQPLCHSSGCRIAKR